LVAVGIQRRADVNMEAAVVPGVEQTQLLHHSILVYPTCKSVRARLGIVKALLQLAEVAIRVISVRQASRLERNDDEVGTRK
jgi:hypothetical protein